MTLKVSAAVLAGGVLGCVFLWPSLAAAQCTAASPDQTCSNAATIAGPLQSQGGTGPDGSPGVAGGNGGNATTINGGTIFPAGAGARGGDGGRGGDAFVRGGNGGAGGSAVLGNSGNIANIGSASSVIGGAGGTGADGNINGGDGGNGGSAALTNSGGIAGAVTVTGGDGGAGGNGGTWGGANGGNGASAVLTNSGLVGGIATVTGGSGGGGNAPSDVSGNGQGGNGGDGGAATLTNFGNIGGAAIVKGGAGGDGGSTDDSSYGGGGGGHGGGASLTNAGTIGGAATASGGAGGDGAHGGEAGGAGDDGGNALLTNSGSIGAAATVLAGDGGRGGQVDNGPGGSGGSGGNAALINTGSIAASAVVKGGKGGFGNDGSGDDGGWGGNGGSASLVNAGHIGAAAAVTGGNGGATGDNQGSDTPAGGNGGDAILANTGTIAGAVSVKGGDGGADKGGGIGGNGGNATLSNWGSITGGVTVTAGSGGAASPWGAAGAAGTATLNVYGGSHITGAIALNGSARFLNFFGGNYSYTLNSLSGVAVTAAGAPFVVIGNTVVVVDPQVSSSILAANARALVDFTRAASDAVPVFSAGTAAGGAVPLAFASADAPSRFDDAFAAVSGASAYASDTMVFKAPTATYADGTSVWARGFAGQRVQQQDGALSRNTNLFYGGMMGADFAVRPDLRYGLYLGGGNTRIAMDLNQGSGSADLFFGGAYARYEIGNSFLHGAVQAGTSRNSINRIINNNLALNGIETATGSFGGWYVSPEATFGQRWALGQFAGATYTLTPSLRLRYLHGHYDGYAETGTAVPLTVGGQTVRTLEERAEAKLTRSVSLGADDLLSASITAGMLGTQRMGGNTVNAALLGQTIPFATTGQANIWGGFGGLGFEWRSRNVTLFSAAEYLTLSDRSNVLSGRAGLRVAF